MAQSKVPLKVDKSNIKSLLSSTDNFLFDCDGVLYRGTTAIEGTAYVVNKIVSMGKKILYVTNNSSKSREQVIKKLTSFGFPADTSNIITSGYVTARYLRGMMKEGKVFSMGDEGLNVELRDQGLQVVVPRDDFVAETTLEKLQEYEKDPEVSAVVVGLEENVTYLKVGQAMSYLYHTDLLFVSTNRDSTFPSSNGKVFPGGGSIVAMVETAAGRGVHVDCGKPGHVMADVIKQDHAIDFSRTLMIGDRLDTDIRFGNENGMRSMLVLTGVSTPETLATLTSHTPSTNSPTTDSPTTDSPPTIPHYYLPSLADFKDLI